MVFQTINTITQKIQIKWFICPMMKISIFYESNTKNEKGHDPIE